MKNKNITEFDYTNTYKTLIKKKMAEIKAICNENNIPFFFIFCIKNNEKVSEYISDGVLLGSRGITLKKDYISKHLCVQNDFDIVPHEQIIDLDLNDLNF